MIDNYRFIGPAYDLLCSVYGGASIRACRRAMLTPAHVRPGDRVLILGVGHGKEAIRALELGAKLTVVDRSKTMLLAFTRNLARHPEGHASRLVHGDVLAFDEPAQHDMVIANFFLNVFDPASMRDVLARMMSCVKPGGTIVIGDFEHPAGSRAMRLLQNLYWTIAVLPFWAVARNSLHRIYDYPQVMREMGLKVEEQQRFRFLGIGQYWSILARKPRHHGPAKTLSFKERTSYLKLHGSHSQSFATLQPGMSHFDLPGVGYMAYMRKWGGTYVLSDPVARPADFEEILTAFHEAHPGACHVQVSKHVIDILHSRLGYHGTQFGSEVKINPTRWTPGGKSKQVIRTAVNGARKRNIAIRECHEPLRAQAVSREWLATRRCKRNEIGFLVRPLDMEYQENVRHFYAFDGEKAIGFVCFDPVYRDGELVSYVPSISRASADFKPGIFYALMTHAIGVFASEKLHQLDLGLLPLLLADDVEAQESRALRRVCRLVFPRGNRLYNFKGVAFAKGRFGGTLERTYCAHRNRLPLREVITAFRLTGLI